MHPIPPNRQRMIRRLIEHAVAEAGAESALLRMRTKCGHEGIGCGKLSDRPLRPELQLRSPEPAPGGIGGTDDGFSFTRL